ncbi:hypothetical protein H4O20_06390 [Aequorivita sp. 609]|uniref:hypothetical protein n=1 Tax=Aequorivita TaxID=153265 RepID=UPI001610A515|nr:MULTISPECIES: hypothetical protein [Aequorivita]MBB6681067.1 hypothetical protein [Aequorivita sp. 609]
MKNQVLIPTSKDRNPFFDSVPKHSQWKFDYGGLESNIDDYSIVLIHWPEKLFNWREPSQEQLLQLEKTIFNWKRNAKVVYVVHNLQRHYGMTTNFKKLYELVLENCDAMVHLGKYSLELFKNKYPSVIHKYIPHPLYTTGFEIFDKAEARKRLGISNNKLMVLTPGNIRSIEERKMLLKVFKKLRVRNKLLVVPRMFKKSLNIEFKGRQRIKKFIDVKKVVESFYNQDYLPEYKFGYGFMNFEDLSLWLSATDIVFIPRIDSLNSGNIFLGLTYKKVIVGPAIGNMKEFLEKLYLPTFNPDDNSSVAASLSNAVKMLKTDLPYNDMDLQVFSPKVIALQWDAFLNDLVNEIN